MAEIVAIGKHQVLESGACQITFLDKAGKATVLTFDVTCLPALANAIGLLTLGRDDTNTEARPQFRTRVNPQTGDIEIQFGRVGSSKCLELRFDPEYAMTIAEALMNEVRKSGRS